VAKFINHYSTVKAAFNCIVITLDGGNIPKLLPAMQFAYADLLLSSFMGGTDEKNMSVYQELQHGPQTLLLELQ